MGSCSSCIKKESKSKSSRPSQEDFRAVAEKMRLLQKEINEMMCEREKESSDYERDVMVFAFKEAEWKQERKRLREEVKRLKQVVEEKEERIRGFEGGGCGGEADQWDLSSFLVEQMKEERAWRDEAVEKWKNLYLAIKKELDDLIQRTHHQGGGGGVNWRAEEMEEMKRELGAKEETIEALKMKLGCAEYEGYKSKREVDILRQSLRIMSNKKKPNTSNIVSGNKETKGSKKNTS